jgi:uncharacterized damage-inducible protein DinB
MGNTLAAVWRRVRGLEPVKLPWITTKEAVKEVAAAGLEEQSELFGFPASKRAYLMILLTHSHEHLGQSIAYARSIGVVPPWSRPQAEEGEGGGGR